MSSVVPSDSTNLPVNQSFAADSTAMSSCELRWTGPVHDSSSRFILDWMENRLDAVQASKLQKKRIVHVAIELLQNLHHHSASPKEKIIFSIHETNSNRWTVQSQNPVTPEAQKPLEDRWTDLKSLNLEALRAQRMKQISKHERSLHGGGGIGLNEILRKSDGSAEMNFSKSQSDVVVTFIAELPLRS